MKDSIEKNYWSFLVRKLTYLSPRIAALPIILTLLISQHVTAQVEVWGPAESSTLHQFTSFSSDFSDSELYDFDNPIKLEITIQGVQFPEDVGYAELLFSIDAASQKSERAAEDPDFVYVATLQTPDELGRLGIRESDFKRGLPAVVTGWPATSKMRSASYMLVDEIDLYRSARKDNPVKKKLHEENERLQEKKFAQSAGTETKKD